MSHECDDCGDVFETLSRLRLHECPGGQSSPTEQSGSADSSDAWTGESAIDDELDRAALEQEYPDVVGDLPELVAGASTGDVVALSRALAEYERRLEAVAGGDAPGGEDLHTDLLFAYYEPLSDGLATAAEQEGWDVLEEFIDAYDPHQQDGFPAVGHVLANALGRSIIQTRQAAGVAAIPDTALAFLGAIPASVSDFHVAYEESYTYGWGIGHPTHSVADHLVALADDEHKFVKITLNTAFYVDQHEAIDVLERLVRADDLSTTTDHFGRTIALNEYYLRAVADLQTDKIMGPHAPPYWDASDELDRTVTVTQEVEERIRELVSATGVESTLPAEWELHDLEQSPLGELLDE